MADEKIRAMKTHMSETKDGKPVPLPISMFRSTPNSGAPIMVLEQGLANATAAVDAVLATPEWTATVKASKDIEATEEQRATCVERLKMLREERARMKKLIREEESRLELIEKDQRRKKRKYSHIVVTEEMTAELETARANLATAEVMLEDGYVRNAAKNVPVKNKALLKKVEKAEPDRVFDYKKMVPLLLWKFIGWYRDMGYTIDTPVVKSEDANVARYDVDEAMNRWNYLVEVTGDGLYVALDDRKDHILPVIHGMDGFHVYGMHESGKKYSAGVLIRPQWENKEEFQGMLKHFWVRKKESEEEEKTESAAADTVASAPPASVPKFGGFVEILSD